MGLEEVDTKIKENRCFKVFFSILRYFRLMLVQVKVQNYLSTSKVLRNEHRCWGQPQFVKGKERVWRLFKKKKKTPEDKTFWMNRIRSLKITIILNRILNIIISIWQGKDPICHKKICPQMKQWHVSNDLVWT